MLTHCPRACQRQPGPGSQPATNTPWPPSLSRQGTSPTPCHKRALTTQPVTMGHQLHSSSQRFPTPQPVTGRSQPHTRCGKQLLAPPVSQAGAPGPQPVPGRSRPHSLTQAGPNATARHRQLLASPVSQAGAPAPTACHEWDRAPLTLIPLGAGQGAGPRHQAALLPFTRGGWSGRLPPPTTDEGAVLN